METNPGLRGILSPHPFYRGKKKEPENNGNWETNLTLTTWTNHYDYQSTTTVVGCFQVVHLLQVSLVTNPSRLTWCQNDDKFCHKFCHYNIHEFLFCPKFCHYITWVLVCYELLSIHEFFFLGELDACFEKEKAKKVRLLLSLSLSSLATICQPQKEEEEEEEEKMKKK